MAQAQRNLPVSLDVLEAYLTSDQAPSECMDLSQLDGFLAGIVAGPTAIDWTEALPVVWGGEAPAFANSDHSAAIIGTIVGRHAEIAAALAYDPADYAPVFWEDLTGNVVVEDWAVGFMQAVALRPAAWHAVLRDEENAMLLIPIGIIAGMAEPDIRLDDAVLPDDMLDNLMEQAEIVLPTCVQGLFAFWRRDTD